MAGTVNKAEPSVVGGGEEHQGDTPARLSGAEIWSAAIDVAGEMTLPLQGASMGPGWLRADAVVVQARGRRAPRWGDVVVFQRHDRWYAHRLILRLGDRCLTKGDARWAWDRPGVALRDVLGVVVALVEDGRRRELPGRHRARAPWELARSLAAWPVFIARRRGGAD